MYIKKHEEFYVVHSLQEIILAPNKKVYVDGVLTSDGSLPQCQHGVYVRTSGLNVVCE